MFGIQAFLAYREAVYAGNFMAMRRAAFAPGTVEDSAKLRRLTEIAEEATADGRKVVVSLFFRDVLEVAAAALGPKAVGPLTGSVPPTARQAMVDEFTARTGPSVLVGQIQAGGVGLNIQAASVVIIAEPQWTPAIEEQAIARCHRMGQVRRVDVHRLLTEDSVDQRVLEILRVKADEFKPRKAGGTRSERQLSYGNVTRPRRSLTQWIGERKGCQMRIIFDISTTYRGGAVHSALRSVLPLRFEMGRHERPGAALAGAEVQLSLGAGGP